jgi:hypothetical protein
MFFYPHSTPDCGSYLPTHQAILHQALTKYPEFNPVLTQPGIYKLRAHFSRQPYQFRSQPQVVDYHLF